MVQKKIRTAPWQPYVKKENYIKLKPVRPNASVENRYYSNLYDLIRRMATQCEQEIKDLYAKPIAQEYFAEDDSIANQAKRLTNKLQKKYDDLFARLSKPMAERFIDDADESQTLGFKKNFKAMTNGLFLDPDVLINGELKEILSASVTANVALIKSISSQYFKDVQGAVMRSITQNGSQGLIPELQKYKNISYRRARMIAHDQTYKIYGNLNKARAEAAGSEEFEWLHVSGSKKPRPMHIALSGKVFRYDDPPITNPQGERHLPSEEINCNCLAHSIFRF